MGYLLGARRLGTATAVLSIVALLFGIAVSQGLVPGLERTDPVENNRGDDKGPALQTLRHSFNPAGNLHGQN